MSLLKIYYKVKCFYITKEAEHIHAFDIGIFDSVKNANQAIEKVKDKPGFCEHSDKIKIYKIIKFSKPKLLNKVFWEDGFVTIKSKYK